MIRIVLQTPKRLTEGKIPAPGTGGSKELEVKATKEGKYAALIFLAGVAAIVLFGLVPSA